MSLTATRLYQTMLAHISKRLGATGQEGQIPAGVPDYALDSMIGALEIMREKAPGLFTQNIGVTFRGPRTGTVSVTDGDTSLFLGTLTPPENGETILIGDDAIHNEIFWIPTDLSDYQLVQNFSGTSGTQSATAYGDSVQIPIAADRILGNHVLSDRGPLGVIAGRMDLTNLGSSGDYGGAGVLGRVRSRAVGIPRAVWLEAWNHPDATAIEYRLRCAPLPSEAFRVTLDVVVKPQEPGEADIEVDALFTFAIPGGRDRTIFKPIALYLWAESPWFAPPPELRKRIDAGYAQALAALEAFRPHAAASGQIVVEG